MNVLEDMLECYALEGDRHEDTESRRTHIESLVMYLLVVP